MLNQWQQEKTALANEKLTLEQVLEFSHKENQTLHGKYDGLLQQLQEKQERIEELHRLHQQTQANLEHYRESAREQRLLDQQQFEQEKQQLQLEIKSLKEQLVMQQHKCTELHQEHQFKERSYIELDKQYNKALQSADALKNKIVQLDKENISYLQASQHWQLQFKEMEIKLENKLAEITSLQSDNKFLSKQLADNKQIQYSLQDQKALLVNEKWELAQEKAQLEGQLMQMQTNLTT